MELDSNYKLDLNYNKLMYLNVNVINTTYEVEFKASATFSILMPSICRGFKGQDENRD